MFFTLICTLNLLPNEQWPYGQETTQRWVLYGGTVVFFLWSNCLQYMQDVASTRDQTSQQSFAWMQSISFPRGRLVQIPMPINVRSSMFALLSTKGNLECEEIHEVWVWLLHPEPSDLDCTDTPGSFLPSWRPPLNLINKGEILSVMKFTLNHRFVSGHRDRSSDERIVCLRLYLYL